MLNVSRTQLTVAYSAIALDVKANQIKREG